MLIVLVANFEKTINQGISSPAFIPFIMFIAGYAILILGYRPESEKTKRFLHELLEEESR